LAEIGLAMKRFKIKTLGCKVNQYETQVIRERLILAGYKEAEGKEKADLCIVNTCTVTAKADKECREILRRFIRENPEAEIIAAGCYVEKDADTIRAIDSKIRVLNNSDKLNGDKGISYFKGHTKAFVKIQDGCNNFCSYCKVPYVRGRSRSRNMEEILKEAGNLISKNYRELVLTGICLGDFGKDLGTGITLTRLIKEISGLRGDFRIRLSSIELPDVTDELIDEMVLLKKICRHFHIPLQSGDNDILRKMNRRYTSNEFVNRIKFIRSKIPGIAITTDVIIGFPQERDENFNNTLKIIKNIKPSRTHIFTYSPRKGTKAFDVKETVSPPEKSDRYRRLKAITDKFAEQFKLSSYNRNQRILIETTRDRDTAKLTGYTDTYVKMFIDGPDEYIGSFVNYHNF
jgi:threonylcarbamoyladenosine tRNA methylthiotransferase MtaB